MRLLQTGGRNLTFESAGTYELKGLDGSHELFRLTGFA